MKLIHEINRTSSFRYGFNERATATNLAKTMLARRNCQSHDVREGVNDAVNEADEITFSRRLTTS